MIRRGYCDNSIFSTSYRGFVILLKMLDDLGCPTCLATWGPSDIGVRELHHTEGCATYRKVSAMLGEDPYE
jgi:hypothetical protein